ncbi:MAG: ATP-binding cassette domain-containing protein [Spirochaetaceae bacterium]|nr:ATP-binding cassette domain-containing protein [Spirochaetaceae bacterium]
MRCPGSTDSELRRVCANAQILSLVEELPAGLDTVIGERGRQLSSGQRQRLILARSMLIERPILILDEATSQLDDPTARLINQKLLDPRLAGTVIIIAHRVSTIMDMPRIVVLDDGRISADGTHRTLMRSSERYRQLFAPDNIASCGITVPSTTLRLPGGSRR